MGDPKKAKKKYSTPKQAWEKGRIDEENEFIKEYYFKNKQEIWKLTSALRDFARQAKKLIALKTEQAEKEKIQLLAKLKSLGLLTESGNLDDVLGITQKDLFDRRLQSIVFKRGMAKSMKQARQFIIHGHVFVNNRKLTSPNYLVRMSEEGSVIFSPNSALADEMHPERKQEEKLPKKPEKNGAKGKAEGKEKRSWKKQEQKPRKEKKPKDKKAQEKYKGEKKAE